jgi:hypothetical protein
MDNNRFTYRSCFKYSSPKNVVVDNSLFSKLNDFSEDYSNPLSRSLKYNNSPLKQNQENFITPNLNSNQGSVLKNINDYNVRESFNIDDNRILKYLLQRRPEYNAFSHELNIYNPIEYKLNKWSKYHEK